VQAGGASFRRLDPKNSAAKSRRFAASQPALAARAIMDTRPDSAQLIEHMVSSVFHNGTHYSKEQSACAPKQAMDLMVQPLPI
jgi:hypothetical protein